VLNLDPAKLLVVAVVAVILLGPDRLPQVARQVGGTWRAFNDFRHRMEAEVRSNVPDLPSTSDIARLARSPSALLDHIGNMTSGEPGAEGADGDPASTATPTVSSTAETGSADEPMSWVSRDYSIETSGSSSVTAATEDVATTPAETGTELETSFAGDPALN
jgi:Sec-independent protein translocase protein TatA